MKYLNWGEIARRLFTLAFVASAIVIPPTVRNALDLKYAHDFPPGVTKKTHSPKTTMELSVYASKYDGRVTRYGRTYDHWNGLTCASNNPAHKNRTLNVTYKGKSLTLMVTDTGGDRRLGYTRLDISGKAMKFFAPKWNGKDKNAPLLKKATVELVKEGKIVDGGESK